MSLLPTDGITTISQLDLSGNYTYDDYYAWKFDERVELIYGKVFPLETPNRQHQSISMKLTCNFHKCLGYDNKCHIYFAPFDVRFSDKNGSVKTVVQPALCVICDQDKLDEKGCIGAPDLVVEILSPGNTKKRDEEQIRTLSRARGKRILDR